MTRGFLRNACMAASVKCMSALMLILLQPAMMWAADGRPPADAETGNPTNAKLPMIDLQAGIHRIRAEVADSESERERGLMWRRHLAPNAGMLFVFDRGDRYCFWMRNTLIPLSIAFIEEHGEIVTVDEMKSQTEDPHCPARPARYALEMNAGWFARHGISTGLTLKGLEQLDSVNAPAELRGDAQRRRQMSAEPTVDEKKPGR